MYVLCDVQLSLAHTTWLYLVLAHTTWLYLVLAQAFTVHQDSELVLWMRAHTVDELKASYTSSLRPQG